jgi:hypothetical protein
VQRKLGPVRKPGSREGLTRAQAEQQLRRRMEHESAIAPARGRLTVEEAGERLIEHLEALGRKKSTIEGYRSTLKVTSARSSATSRSTGSPVRTWKRAWRTVHGRTGRPSRP